MPKEGYEKSTIRYYSWLKKDGTLQRNNFHMRRAFLDFRMAGNASLFEPSLVWNELRRFYGHQKQVSNRRTFSWCSCLRGFLEASIVLSQKPRFCKSDYLKTDFQVYRFQSMTYSLHSYQIHTRTHSRTSLFRTCRVLRQCCRVKVWRTLCSIILGFICWQWSASPTRHHDASLHYHAVSVLQNVHQTASWNILSGMPMHARGHSTRFYWYIFQYQFCQLTVSWGQRSESSFVNSDWEYCSPHIRSDRLTMSEISLPTLFKMQINAGIGLELLVF